jgi:hypothetical protein
MNHHHDLPDAHERARLNTTLLNTAAETGIWDEHGRPTPWPDDIDDWSPDTAQPITPQPGQPPF